MFGATLTASELLRTKGIRTEYWKTWEKTTEMLPSTGQKQYEPNDSWLQNKQIEKGLKSRETLLAMERVERRSQLASAEWLPQESRARVTKKSGQVWTSFGLEENLELYLMPEEALLLLELNCLELSWQGVALSIQQAHGVLLESERRKSDKDDYRVYSYLARQGYRLQRFRYEDDSMASESGIRAQRSSAVKRKARIHDPSNGFAMTRDRVATDDGGGGSIQDSLMAAKEIRNESEGGPETGGSPNSRHVAYDHGETIVKSIDCQTRSQRQNKLPSELYDNGIVNLPGPSNIGAKKGFRNPDKNSLLPTVISDEIFLGELNIIRNWPGARVRKNAREWNMKQNHCQIGRTQDATNPHASGMTVSVENSSEPKRSIHEVPSENIIELSDEEIEEIPQKLSRMEMLNLFPNVISESFVAKQIPKRYLPSHVWPQNVSNRYVGRTVSNITCPSEMDGPSDCNIRTDLFPGLVQRSRNAAARQPDASTANTHRNTVFGNGPWSVADLENAVNRVNVISRQGSCFRKDFFGHHSLRGALQFPRVGHCRRQKNWINMVDNRLDRIEVKRSDISKSSFKIVPGASSWAETKAKWLDEKTITIEDEDCPIREDSSVDENEVKVLAPPGKPLVDVQHLTSVPQVYQHLRIIREATGKNTNGSRKRKQTGCCKLSYNLYSTAQRFKKANPGHPTYRIAVLRQEVNLLHRRNDRFVNPTVGRCILFTSWQESKPRLASHKSDNTPWIELGDMIGLQRVAEESRVVLARASQSSVTFAEFGRVRIPDCSDIHGQRQLNHSP